MITIPKAFAEATIHEATALSVWDGRGAVRMLAVRPEHGVLLLDGWTVAARCALNLLGTPCPSRVACCVGFRCLPQMAYPG